MFHLGANPGLLANIEKQLERGDVSEAVEDEERQLADRHSAEQLCRGVRVLGARVHRGVHVPVATVRHHLHFLLSTRERRKIRSNPYLHLPEQG